MPTNFLMSIILWLLWKMCVSVSVRLWGIFKNLDTFLDTIVIFINGKIVQQIVCFKSSDDWMWKTISNDFPWLLHYDFFSFSLGVCVCVICIWKIIKKNYCIYVVNEFLFFHSTMHSRESLRGDAENVAECNPLRPEDYWTIVLCVWACVCVCVCELWREQFSFFTCLIMCCNTESMIFQIYHHKNVII